MHKGPRLAKALRKCPRVPIEGVWYRSVDSEVFRRFYNESRPMRPLCGLGAPRGGARFTPKDGRSSLYVAEDVETSNREGLQVALGTPVKPPAGVTRTVYTVKVRLGDVVDLREPAVHDLLGTSANELKLGWRYRRDGKMPSTQRLGRVVASSGIEGLIFQSTKGAGACLVIFTDNLAVSSSLEVRDGTQVIQRLP
jgi:RES domain-containing protein